MGAAKFMAQLKTFGVELPEEECQRIIKVYRETYEWFCSTDLVDAPDQLSDPMWGAGYDFALEGEVARELRGR